MTTADWIASGIALLALIVSVASYLNSRTVSRRQDTRDAERLQRDKSADLVLESPGLAAASDGGSEGFVMVVLRNVGRVAARDVSLELQHEVENRPGLMWVVTEVGLGQILRGGGAPSVARLDAPVSELRRDDLEVVVRWEDERGYRKANLGWVRPLN